LHWLAQHGGLPQEQQDELWHRVRRYLMHVTPEGSINPREAKRFINAYTINKMIRPDLEPETMLALQTMDFRPEWETIYDTIVLTEPDTFSDAVRRFREGEREAFEDLWPEIGRLPPELARFLDSVEASGLARHDLAGYVSFLESTRSSLSGMAEAMRDVGLLRRLLRQTHAALETTAVPGGQSAVPDSIGQAREAVSRLRSIGTFAEGKARRAGFEGSGMDRELDELDYWLVRPTRCSNRQNHSRQQQPSGSGTMPTLSSLPSKRSSGWRAAPPPSPDDRTPPLSLAARRFVAPAPSRFNMTPAHSPAAKSECRPPLNTQPAVIADVQARMPWSCLVVVCVAASTAMTAV
jgi:hypothetical protein